jgi:heptaprenyl diphosphate synthase
MKRREVYESVFGAGALFVAGFLIMPALLFNPDTESRCLQFLFFWFLVWLSGKKTNILFTFLVIGVIVAFNLIIPYGRVLFSIGPFRVTSGALVAGIHRAVTLEALVMLSKASIRQDLKIPGAFGELLGESLRIFSVMMSGKYRVTGNSLGKNLIVEIDNLMLELSEEEIPQPSCGVTRTKPAGYVILAAVIILSWLPWIERL